MARKSTKPEAPPRFDSPSQEALWWDSPSGARYIARQLRRAEREGKIRRYPGGISMEQMKELFDEARKAALRAVSIRLPVQDIEEARQVAARYGVGYQTWMKQTIRKELNREARRISRSARKSA